MVHYKRPGHPVDITPFCKLSTTVPNSIALALLLTYDEYGILFYKPARFLMFLDMINKQSGRLVSNVTMFIDRFLYIYVFRDVLPSIF